MDELCGFNEEKLWRKKFMDDDVFENWLKELAAEIFCARNWLPKYTQPKSENCLLLIVLNKVPPDTYSVCLIMILYQFTFSINF